MTFTRSAALAAGIVVCGLSTASADPITYVLMGEVIAGSGRTGIDAGGYFGPAGASIVGDHYTVTWTLASDCECIGQGFGAFPLPNPVIDVVLTINGRDYDFGNYGQFIYGEVYLGVAPGLNIQQTATTGSDRISTNAVSGLGGAFEISGGGDCSCVVTAGKFNFTGAVPGPVAGAGLPGALAALLGWWWRRRYPTRT